MFPEEVRDSQINKVGGKTGHGQSHAVYWDHLSMIGQNLGPLFLLCPSVLTTHKFVLLPGQ